MRLLIIIIVNLCFFQNLFGQQIKELDSLYKEDQFYLAISYNLLGKKPNDVSQKGFSSGFHFGFIKDMPINTRRNVSLGLGLGLSFNSINHNIRISEDASGALVYSRVGSDVFTRNKISAHAIEVPVEIRWRTSTAQMYKFWRIYSGLKVGYVFANTSKYVDDSETIKINNSNDFNTLQYGVNLSVGYNTWNVYLYYALNPIFKNDVLLDSGESLDVNIVKIGLIFYLL